MTIYYIQSNCNRKTWRRKGLADASENGDAVRIGFDLGKKEKHHEFLSLQQQDNNSVRSFYYIQNPRAPFEHKL